MKKLSRKVGRKKKWTKERIIEEIKRLSVDGIAPSTQEVKNLANHAIEQFGSWKEACKTAGVKTRTRTYTKRLKTNTFKKNEKTRMLAMALHIASMRGMTDLDSINNCINAVRYGLADEFYYQVQSRNIFTNEYRGIAG